MQEPNDHPDLSPDAQVTLEDLKAALSNLPPPRALPPVDPTFKPTFHTPDTLLHPVNAHDRGQALTAGEIRAALANVPDDTVVLLTRFWQRDAEPNYQAAADWHHLPAPSEEQNALSRKMFGRPELEPEYHDAVLLRGVITGPLEDGRHALLFLQYI